MVSGLNMLQNNTYFMIKLEKCTLPEYELMTIMAHLHRCQPSVTFEYVISILISYDDYFQVYVVSNEYRIIVTISLGIDIVRTHIANIIK